MEGRGLHFHFRPVTIERYVRGEIKQAGMYTSKAQNRVSAMESPHWQAPTRNGA